MSSKLKNQQKQSYDTTNLVPRPQSVPSSHLPLSRVYFGRIPASLHALAFGANGSIDSSGSHSNCDCDRHGSLSVVLAPFGNDAFRRMYFIRALSFKQKMNIPTPTVNEDTSIMVKCECHGEALEVTHWPNKDIPDEFWFSIWNEGFTRPLCWREKIRWCKNIILTGRPWKDNIILTPEKAKEVADFIYQHVNKSKS